MGDDKQVLDEEGWPVHTSLAFLAFLALCSRRLRGFHPTLWRRQVCVRWSEERPIIMCPQKETASQMRSKDLPAVPCLWHFLCKTFTSTGRPSMCGTELRNNKTRRPDPFVSMACVFIINIGFRDRVKICVRWRHASPL